jgi:hypothetical protein
MRRRNLVRETLTVEIESFARYVDVERPNDTRIRNASWVEWPSTCFAESFESHSKGKSRVVPDHNFGLRRLNSVGNLWAQKRAAHRRLLN